MQKSQVMGLTNKVSSAEIAPREGAVIVPSCEETRLYLIMYIFGATSQQVDKC